MSLNVYNRPDPTETSSPYRPTFLDVSSDTAAIVRVITDVFINGSVTVVTTVEKEPMLGTTDQFRIELSEINKKYLFSEFKTTSLFLETHDNVTSANYIDVLMYEVTEVAGLLVTTWAEAGAGIGGLATPNIYQFNGVNQHLQTIESRLCDGITKKFLTNRPQNSKILNNQIYHCGILPNTEGNRATINITEYDGVNGTGSSLSTGSSTVVTASYKKLSFTIDPSQLNALTKSVVYHAEDMVSAQITEDVTVNVVSECGDEVNLFWQNHWGETDQYFFAGNTIQKTKNKKKAITNRLTLDYASTDRGQRDIKNINTREYEIFTRTENPLVVAWLAEIGESVDTSIMIGTDRVPINVKSVSSEIANDSDATIQISVKYTLANERISQLG
jgi:hypothetical protein